MKLSRVVMHGVVLGTLACDKPAATRDANADVTESVTTARCHREVNCQRVGEGKRFRDDAECRKKLDVRASVALGPATCGAVDTSALGACLDAIQRAKCDDADPFDQACAGDALCTRRDGRKNASITY